MRGLRADRPFAPQPIKIYPTVPRPGQFQLKLIKNMAESAFHAKGEYGRSARYERQETGTGRGERRMTAQYQLLPLAQIRPGMRLAEAIRDRLGNVMLPEDLALTEQHLDSLHQRGVASAMIRLDSLPMSAAEREAHVQAIQTRLDHLFHRSLDDPLNRELKNLIFRYRMEHFS
jgi:hypothetical protein